MSIVQDHRRVKHSHHMNSFYTQEEIADLHENWKRIREKNLERCEKVLKSGSEC